MMGSYLKTHLPNGPQSIPHYHRRQTDIERLLLWPYLTFIPGHQYLTPLITEDQSLWHPKLHFSRKHNNKNVK